MIRQLLRAAERLNDTLKKRLGRPYHVLLSIGLLTEIGHRVHELLTVSMRGTGLVRVLLVIAFGCCLLINQLGELSIRWAKRAN